MKENIKKLSKLIDYKEKKNLYYMIAFAVILVVFILLSVLVTNIPVITACVYVILEAVLASCLSRIQLWIHGMVCIAQIIVGLIFGHVLFAVFMVIVYIAATALLYLWLKDL